MEQARAFLASRFADSALAAGNLVQSAELPQDEGLPEGSILLEHEPIPFENYPYEWSPAMLYRAAELTLDLAQRAADEGFTLKDATPYNIMFRGAQPVFLDILSFGRADERDSLWRPYAQFVRTFIYPLLANRYFGLRLDELLLANRDGMEPERMAAMTPALRRWLPPFLGAVTLPTVLSRGADGDYRPRQAKDAGEARFLLNSTFRRARRLLQSAAVAERKSTVARYMESGHTYTPEQMAAKEQTVREVIERVRPETVLDIGCNTGHFSRIAADAGARVVAIERDPDAAGALYRKAAADRLDILPLVIDFSRPPGACGWENRECASFLERARAKFDCILMLAIVHHLLVSERVPLDRIFDVAMQLTRRHAIVEYVDPADSQFRAIARGRESLHGDLTRESFEATAAKYFAIRSSWRVTATRSVYWLELPE